MSKKVATRAALKKQLLERRHKPTPASSSFKVKKVTTKSIV